MAGRGIVIKIEGDGESAKRALEMVREQMAMTAGEAKHSGGEIEGAMERVKRSLEYVGAYMAFREVLGAIKETIGGTIELGVEIGHLSKQTGISTENLSVLKYAADTTGVSFELLQKGFKKLSTELAEYNGGSKEAKKAFDELGISQKELKATGGDLWQVFELITNKMAKMPEGYAKNDAASKLLGKSGTQLIAMMEELGVSMADIRAEATALGVVLDEAGVKKLEDTHKAVEQMKSAWHGLAFELTNAVSPALKQAAEDMTDLLKDLRTDPKNTFMGLIGGGLAGLGLGNLGTDIMMKAAAGIANSQKPATPSDGFKTDKPRTQPFDPHVTGATKSDDALLRAAAELQDAMATQSAAMMKSATGDIMAIIDAKHKLMEMSDEAYYAKKLTLEQAALKAEEDALWKQIATMQALEKKQHNDKTLKRGKDGKSAEEVQTQARLLALSTQLVESESKSARLDTAAGAATQERAQQVKLATAKIAAKLEEETNTTITARLALMRMENDLELQKIAMSAGKDSPEYRQQQALEGVMEAKSRIADVDRQIRESEENNTRAVKELADAAAKDPRFKDAARSQINALNKAEADSIRTLVAQYDALAQELGGPFLETAKNLHAELDKLNTPDKKDDAAFAKTLAEGVESLGNRIAESSTKGKRAFHDMAVSIGDDALKLALKLAEDKWLTPLLEGAMGGVSGGGSAPGSITNFLPHFADGTNNMGGGPALVGENGPELWQPPAKGGSVATAATLTKLAETGGGGGRAPNITTNVFNQTSTPVTAQPATVSYDSELNQHIVSVILQDHANGGPTRALTGG
ncbi:MAG TPA: hypothetical protein VFG23_22615 [Polyangia bacterium]|nr:hypothetical protein [Polyangia bacterium]